MYYVYILLSIKDSKFYIGYSADLKIRIKAHQSGQVISTKTRLPLKLVYYEAHLSKTDAKRRESYFKTAKGKSSLR
ncbi:MAG TPA: GIY-YIG nuclease family protein, partial [Elusimicrobiales bacterium]|nr:GIY-YIG nuclease family protein [Elusimicrobiales bacterium]